MRQDDLEVSLPDFTGLFCQFFFFAAHPLSKIFSINAASIDRLHVHISFSMVEMVAFSYMKISSVHSSGNSPLTVTPSQRL
jgi:hypothetical protein